MTKITSNRPILRQVPDVSRPGPAPLSTSTVVGRPQVRAGADQNLATFWAAMPPWRARFAQCLDPLHRVGARADDRVDMQGIALVL